MSIIKVTSRKETIKLEVDGKVITLRNLRELIAMTKDLDEDCLVQVDVQKSTHFNWAPNTDEDILESTEEKIKTSLTIEQGK